MAIQLSGSEPLLDSELAIMAKDNRRKFDAHVILAEVMLDLRNFSISGSDAELASLAVQLQVNYQVKQGIDPYIYGSAARTGTSGKSRTYRGNDQSPPQIHGQALRIARGLTKGAWDTVVSVRSGNV